jgi:[ribosomal protein S18]-alanine N-acetyltransferase
MDEARSMELTVSQQADTGKPTTTNMNLNYDFGQALVSDLRDLRQLEVEVYGDHAYSYTVLRQFLDMTGELFQVCRDAAGKVIAYGVVARSVSQDNGWFHSLVVSAKHRRKGIGTTLAKQLINKADLHSLKKLFLTVESNNKDAISLYKKLGFICVRVEPDYYGPNKERIIMQRSRQEESNFWTCRLPTTRD